MKNMPSKGKIVVTGGAGFIGSHLSRALLENGSAVHVIDNLSGGKREHVPEGAIFHEIDILDTLALTTIFKDTRIVFHEAALPRVPFSIDHPLESHRANVDGTLSVLVAARDAHVGKVVYAASASSYGNQETIPLSEDMRAQPVNPYGLQKYMGELYMKIFADLYGLSTVSLRYFNVYGSGLDPDSPYALVFGRFITQIKEGKPLTIIGDGEQTRDFTHVSDVVRANLLASESRQVGKGEVINIGAGRDVSVNYLADLFGGGGRSSLPSRPEARKSRADIRRAKALLGWEPRIRLEDGVVDLKRHYGL